MQCLKKGIVFPKWILNIYLVAVGAMFIHVFLNSFRHGVFISSYLLIVCAYILIYKRYRVVKNGIDLLVFIYACYNLFAVIISGYYSSIGIGISEFTTAGLPIIFYLIGRECNTDEEKNFIKSFIFASSFVIIIGYYFYFFNPDIYFRYLENNTYAFYKSLYLQNPRMFSFVGSPIVGAFANYLLAYSVHQMVMKKSKSKFWLCSSIMAVGAVVLSLQRVSWVCCILVLAVYLFFVSRNKIRTLAIVSIITVAVIIFIINFPEIIETLLWRFSGSEDIFAERNENWWKVFEQNILQVLIGNGLGMAGHRSIGQNVGLVIADGNYFKMLYEIGVLGFGLFVSVIFSCIIKGYKKFLNRKYEVMFYLAVICIVCVHAIGSSAFTFQLNALLFWYSLGRCQSK